MGTVKRLAEDVARGLGQTHPQLRKTVVSKLSLAVGAMIEGQRSNTAELANLLPLETERQDMREQWLRRLLKNPLVQSEAVMEPLACRQLQEAAGNGQVILLRMDQTDLGDRMAVLLVCVRVGDRALPLAWRAEEGAANSGFEGQRILLERMRGWLPAGAAVLFSADRFYPSARLFAWLHRHGWCDRLRLKGNLLVDRGHGEETTTGALAHGVEERFLPPVHLFAEGVMTNLGILREPSHEEAWIVAMACTPRRAAVRNYAVRWAIEPTFCDVKRRGFNLQSSQLAHAERLERLILLMALAMSWCVRVGRDDALHQPTPLEKNACPNRP